MTDQRNMTVSDKEGIFDLVMACHHFGVEDVIISPGSRNAALTLSFNGSGLFRCRSIADERVAGFVGLGLCLATSRPVAVICTSGSAVANLAPALAEAFYVKAPLIAITADRPLAWTDQGNGQTIRQEDIFKNFAVASFSLISEPVSRDEHWWNRRKLSEVFNTALTRNKGPVQINVPMAEPLYNTKSYNMDSWAGFYRSNTFGESIEANAVAGYRKQFENCKKVMVIAGQMQPDEDIDNLLKELSALSNTVVLTETTANTTADKAIDTIDRLVMSVKDESLLKALMPDLLITFGGYVVSKKIKALLRHHSPQVHWHISRYDSSLDTFQALSDEILAAPGPFLAAVITDLTPVNSTYSSQWFDLKSIAKKAHHDYMARLPFSDFYAFAEIIAAMKSPSTLHMANSSPVRYVQLFGNQPHIVYQANRGTSGIDGCTSTAVGFAMGQADRQHILITGDVAFLYDSNALWNKAFPQNLKIILINNGGGGIFRIIEGPDTTKELEDFFEANHPVDISKLAKAYGMPFLKADDKPSLKNALSNFLSADGSQLLEILTPTVENAKILKDYFKFIWSEMEAMHKSREVEK